MTDGNLDLWSLFASSFISSTVAPGGSEAVLAWLVSRSSISTPLLLVTATVGNTLGALTTLAARNIRAKRIFESENAGKTKKYCNRSSEKVGNSGFAFFVVTAYRRRPLLCGRLVEVAGSTVDCGHIDREIMPVCGGSVFVCVKL